MVGGGRVCGYLGGGNKVMDVIEVILTSSPELDHCLCEKR